MRITFTGTGTSQGVPIISCPCEVCTSTDRRDKRLRSSILVETDDVNFVIDTGPDFRYQMLRANSKKLDAVVFTHGHKDHTAGLDDVRAYNYFQQKPMDIYATEATQDVLRREFSYVFDNPNYPGIPQLDLHTITADEDFYVGDVRIIPIGVMHHRMEVLGFRVGDFTYITDANYIPPDQIEKIKGSKILVLNALRHEAHISHFTLEEAVLLAQEIGVEQAYFTHISHQLGKHADIDPYLPKGMDLAYDELQIEV